MQTKSKHTRRDLLKIGAAVTGAGVAASAGVMAYEAASRDNPAPDGAASLMPAWEKAARTMLEAERELSRVSDAAFVEIRNTLPELPKKDWNDRPLEPRPSEYASKAAFKEYGLAMAAFYDHDNPDRFSIVDAAHRKLDEDGRKNPKYHAALAQYQEQLKDHNAPADAHAAARRRIEERHGLPQADKADTAATKAWRKAHAALLAAPIHSERDALAVMTALLFNCNMTGQPFDEQKKAAAVLEKLRPFLPASPSSLPKNWDIT